ncbi:hypothetical protein [Mycobacterium sp. OTB74]|uniref:hypothetical protein n=1 Tax=Mycobacterium sp. OTB74 TaxID=1853452 RepID=UPI0024755B88|nr:hypothetical protein [Mycobacterium sp. OTB74]MDH6245472.1 hypothetical protein [Mycobacterium sp. OTB74]
MTQMNDDPNFHEQAPPVDETKPDDGQSAGARSADASSPKPDNSAPKSRAASGGPSTGDKVLKHLGLPREALRDLTTDPIKGVSGLAKAQWKSGQAPMVKAAEVVGKALPGPLAKGLAKGAFRTVPLIGTVLSAETAYEDIKDGDVVGALLSTVGVIPGPVGWLGIGGAALWEMSGMGHHGYGLWDAPDGTATHMLPGSAKDVAGVQDIDAKLTAAQKQVFGFQDGPQGSVWNSTPPEPLRVDTPAVQSAVTSWLAGIADLFHQIDQTMQNSGEPYILKARQDLSAHFAAMAKLPSQGPLVIAQLTAASDGAGAAYKAVLDANKAARTQLADNGSLTDAGPATTMQTQLASASKKIDAANKKLEAIFAGDPPPPVTVSANPGLHDHPKAAIAPNPAPAAPVVAAPPVAAAPTVPAKDAANKDDLSHLLSSLGRPSMGNASPLGGGGMPLGGGTPMSSSPLGGGRALGGDSEPHKLDTGKLGERKEDKPKSLSASTPDNRTVPRGPGAPAPAVLGTPGTPVPGTATAKPAAATTPNTTVDVKGRKVTFPDATRAKLAQIVAAADPAHPVSLADAAAKAGLTPPVPGQDPGQQVPPTDAKPGDVLVAGGKRYLLLGDGQFYDLTDYKTVGADALPKDMGPDAGYFHLIDPAAPGASGAAPGPVSGPTGGVPFTVPGGTPAPTVPVDASAPPAGPAAAPAPMPPAPPAAPSPAAPPAAPAPQGPVSVHASGTPGVPAQGTGGPANAAATDTGLGHNAPSTGGHDLDPGAIK